MRVYLGAVGETDQAGILQSHAVFSKSHEIVTDPSAADVILIGTPEPSGEASSCKKIRFGPSFRMIGSSLKWRRSNRTSAEPTNLSKAL